MDDKNMTEGISPEGLSGPFQIAAETEEGDTPASPAEAKEHLLRAALAGDLPLEQEVIKALPALAGQLHPLGRRSLGESLLDPAAPLEVVKAIQPILNRITADVRGAVMKVDCQPPPVPPLAGLHKSVCGFAGRGAAELQRDTICWVGLLRLSAT